MVYALFSGQPLTIIGSTGPILAFIAALFSMSTYASLPFLPLYAWTGIWTSGFLVLCSLRSVSNLVKYLSRFTDEVVWGWGWSDGEEGGGGGRGEAWCDGVGGGSGFHVDICVSSIPAIIIAVADAPVKKQPHLSFPNNRPHLSIKVFANLISFIFIYEAVKGLVKTVNNPSVPAEQVNYVMQRSLSPYSSSTQTQTDSHVKRKRIHYRTALKKNRPFCRSFWRAEH
jgi:hypothetical protein